jgi:hypothetical protein
METDTTEITVRVSIEVPRGQGYSEDFPVPREQWESMTEAQQADYVDRELYPQALANSGVGGSYTVVDEGEATD